MPIDFPTSPIAGQTYDFGGVRYTFIEAGGSGYWAVTTPGTVGAATGPEIDAGVDTVKYITPLGLEDSDYVKATDAALTGTPTAPTPGANSDDVSIATTAFVKRDVDSRNLAPLNSPAFTGTPTAPTPPAGSNDTTVATTAFVQSAQNPDTQISAWVSFRGNSTVLIRDSFNVSSMTDRGVGTYTANFTTAMTTTNYAFSGSGQYINGHTAVLVGQNSTDTKNTGSLQFHTSNSTSGKVVDYSNVNLIVAGGSL